MKYLLDTDTCIYFLKKKQSVKKRIEKEGVESCAISEITIAELKYGIEKSDEKRKAGNLEGLRYLIDSLIVLPVINSFDIYAKEKVRLQKEGNIIDDFDLLIGTTAIVNNLILVTNNDRHFKRLNDIKIENWLYEQ